MMAWCTMRCNSLRESSKAKEARLRNRRKIRGAELLHVLVLLEESESHGFPDVGLHGIRDLRGFVGFRD